MVLTTTARLNLYNNKRLHVYFDEIKSLFNFLVRRTIHHLKYDLNNIKESIYRTAMMREFNLTNRFAKAVLNQAKMLFKLHKENHKWYTKDYLPNRIDDINEKIIKCKDRLDKTVIKITDSKSKAKRKKKTIRNNKTKLFYLQVKLNKINQYLRNQNKKLIKTFGTKKLFRQDINKFLEKRDNQIYYMGVASEFKQNQQFQISYNSKYNKFDYKLRLENNYINEFDNSKYITGSFIIKDKTVKRKILNILKNRDKPLSYRIIKQRSKLYLQIMYKINKKDYTRDSHGVIGIDFNKGFVNLTRIDETGKIRDIKKLCYIHSGRAGVTKNSMHQLCNTITKYSLETGLDLVIENLKSLNKKKFKSYNKKYNKFFNEFKFSRFKTFLENSCIKRGSHLHMINPYNTSKIAIEKYCYPLKLNSHQGASFVIARRYYNMD